MASRSEHLSPGIPQYLIEHSAPPGSVLTDLAAETARHFPDAAGMQIGPDQGAFLTMLVQVTGARRALEVGTFTGYSSICIARGLPHDGHLTCCDVSDEWTSVARRYWQLAGVDDRTELRLGPALDTLRALPPGQDLDLSFIDADKAGYIDYWEQIVPRTRPGGLILADNTLYSGRVTDPADTAPVVTHIRAFNDHVHADPRVDVVLLPVGDGLTIARKR